MKNFKTALFPLLITAFLISACPSSKNNAGNQLSDYSPVSKGLYDTIAYMDSVFFDAFNTRNLDTLKTFLSEDLEFYHDLGGVTNYEQNIEAFKKNFEKDRQVRRELVAGSLEVYPINNYGAVETGMHHFYGTEKGKEEKLGSKAKFVQIWQKTEAAWKITRIISYAHQEY